MLSKKFLVYTELGSRRERNRVEREQEERDLVIDDVWMKQEAEKKRKQLGRSN